ncbi:hypothetical protein CLAFUW4_12319 [Fulvia fulva]|uniref:Uncharacterized protein n=1 Tax=Passalora fulva TaxID=5499 RepID=A0A9Q8PEC2_PASFU|nr:uncharacterized protein CLAFUR5_11349 [Fulvia fulva]KAK4618054.1 hypothetical protein CLAFUR4_12324 [Fulvia fulva]KAK4618892.1 hypothetical protein CLAFUR0_12335 [Fulvia fulva]UJO21014.1 hypothetical protein CLAFUR5_11349 [Fulvia fulva]WPV17830.1 hypothetical protein CLAFUW4_12319 [Fulvia fulva]WPV33654.1 hypothetical protein CLAFUW7_12326 [Fulvia fulva]
MNNIREKLKRKLSLHDKNPNIDEYDNADDVDEETTGHLHREIEKAEESNQPYGKPGSFLNKLILHGNKKTEDEMLRGQQANTQQLAKENVKS